MPKLNQDLDVTKLSTGNFQFSHQRIDDLGASGYTIVDIEVDASGSTETFRPEMVKVLKEILNSCKYSKRSDNLMLRVARFSSTVEEVHGYKTLDKCNPDDYDTFFDKLPGGMTALYDACVVGGESLNTYGADLVKQNFDANGIFFAITDGCNNNSTFGVNDVKSKLLLPVQGETLESMVRILIGINLTEPMVKSELEAFSKNAGFDQFIDAGTVNAKMLAKLAKFVSKSISSQSQALTSGGPSKALTF